MTASLPDKKTVADALHDVIGNDIVSDIEIVKGEGGARVLFTLQVDPAQGSKLEPLRQAAEKAVAAIKGVTQVTGILTAERAPAAVTPQAAPASPRSISHKVSSKPVAPNVKYIIAVASGKGGVGKSTIAANLAAALAAMGQKTGLLDADIYGSSQPAMMGVRQKPVTDERDMIVPVQAHGIQVMSMGFFIEPGAPVVWRGPMVHSAIQQMLRDVDWGTLDILVIDMPPGTGDAQLSIAQNVPLAGAIIVSTPQNVALAEAIKGARMFEKTRVPLLGFVENMSRHVCTACGHEDHIFDHGHVAAAAAEMNTAYLGDIPLLGTIRAQADKGTPFVLAEPLHPAAAAFRALAAAVLTALHATKKTATA